MSTTTAEARISGNLAVALRLPDNCWTRILEYCEYDYGELKEVMRVCKKIQRSVKGPTLEGIIFRLKPPRPLISLAVPAGRRITLHPTIERLVDVKFKKLRRAMFTGDDPYEDYFIHYPSLLQDYATAPASIIISIVFKFLPPIELTNKNGVTVEEVLVGIANFWSSTPPENEVRRVQAKRAEEKEFEREMREDEGESTGDSDSDSSSEEEDGDRDDSSSDEEEAEEEGVTWLDAFELKKRTSWDDWDSCLTYNGVYTELKGLPFVE